MTERLPAWIVAVRGEPGKRGFEIAIVRTSYKHGLRSYGWIGPDKLLVSSSSHDCVTHEVWHRLVSIADDLCAEMNAAEVET